MIVCTVTVIPVSRMATEAYGPGVALIFPAMLGQPATSGTEFSRVRRRARCGSLRYFRNGLWPTPERIHGATTCLRGRTCGILHHAISDLDGDFYRVHDRRTYSPALG
jgi:hypothetical protein